MTDVHHAPTATQPSLDLSGLEHTGARPGTAAIALPSRSGIAGHQLSAPLLQRSMTAPLDRSDSNIASIDATNKLTGLSITTSVSMTNCGSDSSPVVGNATTITPAGPASASLSSMSGSLFNKPSSISLFQTCRLLRDRLCRVDGFKPFLESAATQTDENDNMVGTTSALRDPVDELWRCFRLGSSLVRIFNATRPVTELVARSPEDIASLNTRKKDVYHFLLACKNQLNFPDDDLFSITELFSENTNGFVKVTRTVSLVLDILERRNLLIEADASACAGSTASLAAMATTNTQAGPKDMRDKVIAELLETERKYVAHLEVLQNYQQEILAKEILPVDTAHHLFANLNALVDFQRRFLIGLEATCSLSANDQRIGQVFVNNEQAFSVYEPFCSNYASASDLIVSETARLRRLDHLVEAGYELPSLLIRPIQRICKYPLLLRELVKSTDPAQPSHLDLEQGAESAMRVTDRVNETRRKQENAVIVTDLEKRVEDWKGHSIATFGALLLEDTFQVMKGDVEREYRCYLFERILLCCKETTSNKKSGKNISISKKPKKRSGTLQLKGRIFLNNVTEVVPNSRSGVHTLHVYWRGDQEQEFFTLKCRNEENLRQWHAGLTKSLEDVRIQLQEYRSNATVVSSSAYRGTGSSLGDYRLGVNGVSYDSDEESQRTTDTYDDMQDHMSAASVPMSREASATSIRSRSATNESLPYQGRVNMARIPSNGGGAAASFPRHLAMDQSVFSPIINSADSSASGTLGKWSAAHGGYPFPAAGELELPCNHVSNAAVRYTAPAMSRSGSRQSDSSQGRGHYAAIPTRASAPGTRPILGSRMRSTSSPHMAQGQHFMTTPSDVPEMPSHRMPSMTSSQTSYISNSAESFTSSPAFGVIPSTTAASGTSTAVKCKISYAEDAYVIVLAENASLASLMERVTRKIRLAGHSPSMSQQAASSAGLDPLAAAKSDHDLAGRLRIRYRDEDGDLITINSDEDVSMAIEGVIADGPHATLNLVVTTA
ncbi:Guanine nucleotide exchange factor for Cdc42p [Savitreella phatthalungensis]